MSDDAGSVEAACHWCGEPVDHPPAGVCDRCKARLRAAEAARQRPSALWPRSRIEVGHTADTILGAPLTLSFIQAFRNSFSMRFDLEGARAEVQGTGELNPQPRLLGPWDAWDDAGNEYTGIGGEGGQTGSSSWGDIWFVPALDPAATELTIAATSQGETVFRTTFALGERSPWSPMAPPSTRVMPRDERPYSAVLEQIIQIVTGISGPPFDPLVEHLLHQADAFHARGLGRLVGMIAPGEARSSSTPSWPTRSPAPCWPPMGLGYSEIRRTMVEWCPAPEPQGRCRERAPSDQICAP